MSDDQFPQTWVTNEIPPRMLKVKGVALMDRDCLVAEIIGEKHGPLWVVEHSGYVIGIGAEVYAIPCGEPRP